ncbi:MAG TPA: ABC transporter permease [Polyangiales bacterium]|nr:ABC transporter permease [Polyangiales bacterium]
MVRVRLETRPTPSSTMAMITPLIALAATIVLGTLLFVVLGTDPGKALSMFFVEPLKNAAGWSELAVKATPLALVALGLSVCYRSNVWNIGAEGQYILGAIFASGVSLHATEETSGLYVVLVLLAGVAGGMLWSGIVAFLRDRFHANEILVSLMLVYVAEMLLGYLVYGPWKDPEGFNFPQTISFASGAGLPAMISGYRVHWGAPLALAIVVLAWLFIFHTFAGFRLLVVGMAPAAARYAGFSTRKSLWIALLISGGLAGLAGALEIAGPLDQLTPYVPVGYGFAAIIVAFVGRLHPIGVVFSALLMSLFYIGGELAQSRLGLPKAISSVFQGILLFTLLAADTLVNHKLRLIRTAPPVIAPPLAAKGAAE